MVVGNLFILVAGLSWVKSTGCDWSPTMIMSQAGPGCLPKSAEVHCNIEVSESAGHYDGSKELINGRTNYLCLSAVLCSAYTHLHYPGSEPLNGVPDSEAGPLGHGVVDDELLRAVWSLLISLLWWYEGEVGRDVGKY